MPNGILLGPNGGRVIRSNGSQTVLGPGDCECCGGTSICEQIGNAPVIAASVSGATVCPTITGTFLHRLCGFFQVSRVRYQFTSPNRVFSLSRVGSCQWTAEIPVTPFVFQRELDTCLVSYTCIGLRATVVPSDTGLAMEVCMVHPEGGGGCWSLWRATSTTSDPYTLAGVDLGGCVSGDPPSHLLGARGGLAFIEVPE